MNEPGIDGKSFEIEFNWDNKRINLIDLKQGLKYEARLIAPRTNYVPKTYIDHVLKGTLNNKDFTVEFVILPDQYEHLGIDGRYFYIKSLTPLISGDLIFANSINLVII